jgi:site-specific DNA-methyltransferase (adenine-specific)
MTTSEIHNVNCMDYMTNTPDKFFELAIVDPPYGIGKNWHKNKNSSFYSHKSSYSNDKIPDKKYFQELFRISKNQIIWGGNYFTEYLPSHNCNSWIVWDKGRNYKIQHMAEGELAWTSFKIPVRIVRRLWWGAALASQEARYIRTKSQFHSTCG